MTGTIRRALLLGGLVLTACLALGLLPGLSTSARAATAPTGFTDSRVAGVGAPTALAFTPDGRMLVSTQQGKIQVFDKKGTLLKDGALNLPASKLCSNSERGLLGVAVDPDFATNNYIYAYYTFNKSGVCPTGQPTNPGNPVNRVSRFELSDTNTVNLATEKVLVDNMPSPAGNHNAGDLHFGKDGYLYVSVGDGGCDYANNSGCAGANDAARDPHVLLGKILRVTRDGGVPSDNPYATTGDRCAVAGRTAAGRRCQETYASGLRNPFRFAMDPDAAGTRFFINDVGQRRWEEVDEGKAGADYGWNVCEGNYDNPDRPGVTTCGAPYTPPVHNYDRSVGTSITGGAFVPNGVWPTSYDPAYLFGDFVSGKIFRLAPNPAGGYTRSEFISGLGGSSAVAMTFGPYENTQALYYTTYAGGGEVRRVAYTDAPSAALVSEQPYAADAPYRISFDGSGSRDPNGESLTYLWDFGDGEKAETGTPTTTHAYAESGDYTATLRVRDTSGATSGPATLEVYPGNDAPLPVIEAPATDKLFRVGEELTLTGSAADREDGQLPAEKLSWQVLRHHNGDHAHPYFSGTGNGLKLDAPAPEDLYATGEGNYLEIRLTATDERGLSRTTTRRIEPRRVDVAFGTEPVDLELRVNGQSIRAPKTLVSWEGYDLAVEAPEQIGGDDRRPYGDASWSDGGASSHAITTPATAASYTATFKELPPRTTAFYLRPPPTLVPYNGATTLVGALSGPYGPVPNETVAVWRSTNGGLSWVADGGASYDPASRTYRATRFLDRNALFQMRFAGDTAYRASNSGAVRVGARAYLSRPVAPATARVGRTFEVGGFLRPYHAGTTRLYFYRLTGNGWRFYKAADARNARYGSYTRYGLRYRPPTAGRWYVIARHADASHAATTSPREYFRVVE
jgi:glucose/arabinose dehydrogenase